MKIKRKELVATLQKVGRSLSRSSSQEQSDAFLFSGGNVYAFSEDVLCVAPCQIELEGAVDAAKLIDALTKNFSKDEIEIKVANGKLLLTEPKRRAQFRYEPIVITLPKIDISEWDEVSQEFLTALHIAADAAANQSARFDLMCIHVTPSYVEACDNFQVLRYKVKTPVEVNQLLMASSIKQLTNVKGISEADDFVYFEDSDEVIYGCRRYVDKYPDLSAFLKAQKGIPFSFPKQLGDMSTRAALFAESDGMRYVSVDLKKGVLKITGKSGKGKYEEIEKVEYDGPEVGFTISAVLLSKLALLVSSCELVENRIVAKGDKFVYCVSTQVAETDD